MTEFRMMKNRDGGWEARSRVPLFDDMILNIRTHKSHRKGWLVTYVTAFRVENGFETFAMFKDFHITANTTTGRATENSISALHQNTLGNLDEIKAEALAHYQKEEAHA